MEKYTFDDDVTCGDNDIILNICITLYVHVLLIYYLKVYHFTVFSESILFPPCNLHNMDRTGIIPIYQQ